MNLERRSCQGTIKKIIHIWNSVDFTEHEIRKRTVHNLNFCKIKFSKISIYNWPSKLQKVRHLKIRLLVFKKASVDMLSGTPCICDCLMEDNVLLPWKVLPNKLICIRSVCNIKKEDVLLGGLRAWFMTHNSEIMRTNFEINLHVKRYREQNIFKRPLIVTLILGLT